MKRQPICILAVSQGIGVPQLGTERPARAPAGRPRTCLLKSWLLGSHAVPGGFGENRGSHGIPPISRTTIIGRRRAKESRLRQSIVIFHRCPSRNAGTSKAAGLQGDLTNHHWLFPCGGTLARCAS